MPMKGFTRLSASMSIWTVEEGEWWMEEG